MFHPNFLRSTSPSTSPHFPVSARPNPPGFIPSENFTDEHGKDEHQLRPGFLWPEEEKLVLFRIKVQEEGLALEL